MTLSPDVRELLERMAFGQAAEGSAQPAGHSCRICSIPANGWQADMIRKAAGVHAASNPQELRSALQNPDISVVFLPQSALVTPSVLERCCRESALSKVIVRESE
jgi:hypothetical protein